MRVLVTGAAGSIGSVLSSGLVDRGHTVVGLDLTPEPRGLPRRVGHGRLLRPGRRRGGVRGRSESGRDRRRRPPRGHPHRGLPARRAHLARRDHGRVARRDGRARRDADRLRRQQPRRGPDPSSRRRTADGRRTPPTRHLLRRRQGRGRGAAQPVRRPLRHRRGVHPDRQLPAGAGEHPEPGHLAVARRRGADVRRRPHRTRPGLRGDLRRLGQHPRLVGPRPRHVRWATTRRTTPRTSPTRSPATPSATRSRAPTSAGPSQARSCTDPPSTAWRQAHERSPGPCTGLGRRGPRRADPGRARGARRGGRGRPGRRRRRGPRGPFRRSARVRHGRPPRRPRCGSEPDEPGRGDPCRGRPRGVPGQARATHDGTVVVGYDARHNSDVFAEDTAAVMVGAGLDAVLLPRPLPTPLLAYAIRSLGCVAGVMVTASHNPPQDNGYKVYLGDGSQIVPPADAEISAEIDAVGALAGVRREAGWTTARRRRRRVLPHRRRPAGGPGRPARPGHRLHAAARGRRRDRRHRHGAGRLPGAARRDRPGRARPGLPDGRVPQPGGAGRHGPRDGARRGGRRRRGGRQRPGRGPLRGGGARRARLADAARRRGRRAPRRLPAPQREARASTPTRSSPRRCSAPSPRRHGQPHQETLTGFKWIGRVEGLAFGYEEALGYCVAPDLVRDKDGVSALLLVVELAARLKAEGRTLTDRLDDIAREHGLTPPTSSRSGSPTCP